MKQYVEQPIIHIYLLFAPFLQNQYGLYYDIIAFCVQIKQSNISTFIKATKMLQQITNIGQSLINKVPESIISNQKVNLACLKSKNKIKEAIKLIGQVFQGLVVYSNGIKNETLLKISAKTEGALCKIQQLIKVQNQEKSNLQVIPLKKRAKLIILRLNRLLLTQGQNTMESVIQILNSGKVTLEKMYLPFYISLKATLLVTKQMMIQTLQKRLNVMRVTYKTSKETITMFVEGNFNEEKIRQTISEGMKIFKQITVKVVQKGLQIKVDKKSLFQNYDIFCLKFISALRSMKEISSQNIISLRENSLNLYQQVICRIKEKQILIKTQYRNIRSQMKVIKSE